MLSVELVLACVCISTHLGTMPAHAVDNVEADSFGPSSRLARSTDDANVNRRARAVNATGDSFDHATDRCCETVALSGIDDRRYYRDAMGAFSRRNATVSTTSHFLPQFNGRPVYRHTEADYFLFYRKQHWVVGSTVAERTVVFTYSVDATPLACPSNASDWNSAALDYGKYVRTHIDAHNARVMLWLILFVAPALFSAIKTNVPGYVAPWLRIMTATLSSTR